MPFVTSATIAVHDQVLALGQHTVYNMLTEMQKFTSSIAFNQVLPLRLWWSDNYKKVSIDGETMILDTFRLGIQQLLQTTWELYDTITDSRGKRFTDKLPKNFKDDLSDDTYGYSFLSHGPFTRTPKSILNHIIHSHNLKPFVNDKGRLGWDDTAICSLFRTFDQLNTILSVLTFILPSTSTRVTEFIDHKFRNDVRSRNVHMLTGEMFLLLKYDKMTNTTGMDKCIPAFYPKPLQDLTLKILAGGLRECEIYLASVLFGKDLESVKLYSTSVETPPPPSSRADNILLSASPLHQQIPVGPRRKTGHSGQVQWPVQINYGQIFWVQDQAKVLPANGDRYSTEAHPS